MNTFPSCDDAVGVGRAFIRKAGSAPSSFCSPFTTVLSAPVLGVVLVLSLTACGINVEGQVNAFLFDAGTPPEALPTCAVEIEIDFFDESSAELVRTYHFNSAGTVERFEERRSSASPDRGPPGSLDYHVTVDESGRTVGLLTAGAAGDEAVVDVRAGHFGNRPGTLISERHPDPVGPLTNETTWRRSNQHTWEYDAANVLARTDMSLVVESGDEIITEYTTTTRFLYTGLENERFVATLEWETQYDVNRTLFQYTLHGDEPRASPVRMEMDRRFNDDVVTHYAYEITRTPAALVVDIDIPDGFPSQETYDVFRGPRGHPARLSRRGSFFVCQMVFTDPLGRPIWIEQDGNYCSNPPTETKNTDGFVVHEETNDISARYWITNECEDVCELKPAPPLDDDTALSLLFELFGGESLLPLRPLRRELIPRFPTCELKR